MNLKRPEEPVEIKKRILALRTRLGEDQDVDWDSEAVWYKNEIPRYLWNAWKKDLNEFGLPWPRFLKLMKYHTSDSILWVMGLLLWDELVDKLKLSIDGPLGKSLRPRVTNFVE